MEQKILDDFDAAYALNCDQKTMRIKHRMAGPANPFNPMNKAPAEHIVPDIITMNPCKVNMRGVDTKSVPFSGKLGDLGHRILNDYKKARQVTAFDWHEEQFV